MKKGQVILLIIGTALLAFLYFSPTTPKSDTVDSEEAVDHQEGDHDHEADARVDAALQALRDGSRPPMEAIMEIREVAESYPENLKAQFTLGVLSLQTGQYDKAEERFIKVTELDRNNAEAWRLLAESRLRQGDTLQARNDLDHALKLSDEETKVRYLEELPELKTN